MATKKRPSPTEQDIRRWAEAISDVDIDGFDSFEKGWNEYFQDDLTTQRRTDLKMATFRELRKIRPDISEVRRKVVRHPTKAKPPKVRREFELRGKTKERVVKIRRDTFKSKGKTRTVHRDRLGRFASIKR